MKVQRGNGLLHRVPSAQLGHLAHEGGTRVGHGGLDRFGTVAGDDHGVAGPQGLGGVHNVVQ